MGEELCLPMAEDHRLRVLDNRVLRPKVAHTRTSPACESSSGSLAREPGSDIFHSMNAMCSGKKERIEKGGKCGLRSGC